MNGRPYQLEAVDHVFKSFTEGKKTALIVAPTGTGKTVTFALIIQRFASVYPSHLRVLVIAHREELIHQAAQKIERVIGERPDVEMASLRADLHMFHRAKVVVASKDTLQGKRLERFDPKTFGLIITDECHHAPATSYQSIYKHFADALHVGVTATPDRHDEVALGKVFHDAEPYVYELPDAIKDGYLVPIKQHSVVVEGLDYSGVRTTAGDLNGRDLADVMNNEEVLQQIAAATVADSGSRRTIVFAPPGFKKDGEDCFRVSERLTEILNRHRPDSAQLVMGTTPSEERKATLIDFSAGRFQFLVNVGVFTEGFDEPGIELVVMARATKSRALYAQMIGRGTRPLPGLIDGLDTAEQRRAAIAASAKPELVVLDFEGNAGSHKLIHTADVLGGNYDDEVVDLANKMARKSGKPTDMANALELAAEQIRRRKEYDRLRRIHLVAKAEYSKREINPFDLVGIEPPRSRGWDHEQPPSDKQMATLAKFGIPTNGIHTKKQAGAILSKCIDDVKAGRASYKQRALLAKFGYVGNYSFAQASGLIEQCIAAKKKKWMTA